MPNKHTPIAPESATHDDAATVGTHILSAFSDAGLRDELTRRATADKVGVDRMIYVGGSKTSFSCDCGCNVFRVSGPNRYRCNSCSEDWTGTP